MEQDPWRSSLVDPFREEFLADPERLPEAVLRCAEPLRGEPAFDPELVERRAERLALPPKLESAPPLLARSVRVGLAHIDLTFQGDHPKYGTGAYAQECHEGFPPTIIAAVDALTLWNRGDRAARLFGYWLEHFVRHDGTIDYYGPSLSEYGQLLTTARRLLSRGAPDGWLAAHREPLHRLAGYLLGLLGAADEGLLSGCPEADTREDTATYFHNNAWVARGLSDWAFVLRSAAGEHRQADAVEAASRRLASGVVAAVRDAWPAEDTGPSEGDRWWLRPMLEPESAGGLERPAGRVTASRLGSYTNYRYWPELLSSGVLPEDLARRVVRARLTGGGQLCGMTRFEGHLDDWPLADYLEGLWRLGLREDYRLTLWGHVVYHQAEGHLTAYEQVTFAPGRPVADYCLPCQLVAARAVPRLLGLQPG